MEATRHVVVLQMTLLHGPALCPRANPKALWQGSGGNELAELHGGSSVRPFSSISSSSSMSSSSSRGRRERRRGVRRFGVVCGFSDYYSVLGVEQGASKQDIKTAFRSLARKHHPDIDSSSDATQRFKEIVAAYEVLSNDQRRQLYNRTLLEMAAAAAASAAASASAVRRRRGQTGAGAAQSGQEYSPRSVRQQQQQQQQQQQHASSSSHAAGAAGGVGGGVSAGTAERSYKLRSRSSSYFRWPLDYQRQRQQQQQQKGAAAAAASESASSSSSSPFASSAYAYQQRPRQQQGGHNASEEDCRGAGEASSAGARDADGIPLRGHEGYRRPFQSPRKASSSGFDPKGIRDFLHRRRAFAKRVRKTGRYALGSDVFFLWVSALMWTLNGVNATIAWLAFVLVASNQTRLGYKVAAVVAWRLGGHKGLVLVLMLHLCVWLMGSVHHHLVAAASISVWLHSTIIGFAILSPTTITLLVLKSMGFQVLHPKF